MSQHNPFLHESVYRGDDYNKVALDRPILICGCGAIGSNLANNLCRLGFDSFVLLDMDRVETHNIGTQTWNQDDVGMLKVDALGNQLIDINPAIAFDTKYKELTAKNVKSIVKNVSLVVDCFDNNEARKVITEFCSQKNIPCLHGGLFEDYGEVFWNEKYKVPQDEADANDVCDYPLARNIVLLVTIIMSEEILRFFLTDDKNKTNWIITLKDLKIMGVI